MGFFSREELKTIASSPMISYVPRCGACGLKDNCNSPQLPVVGQGKMEILIIGKAPGEHEDLHGRQWIGTSSQWFAKELQSNGILMQRDCWATNSLICHPKGMRVTEKQMESCRPQIIGEIETRKPRLIFLVGEEAVKSVLGHYWQKNTGGIERWEGFRIPSRTLNAWICPVKHPASLFRREDKTTKVREVRLRNQINEAAQLLKNQDRPWDDVPDYRKNVRIVYEEDARSAIRRFREKGDPVSFDYETNRLKPDPDDAEIVCASISDGETTVAFPWTRTIIPEFSDLLRSSVAKIGFNVKFEERWTRKILGHGVRNWQWDGMLAAHVIDNRPGICSLNFQVFALFGLPPYDYQTKPFLESEGSGVNRIRDLDPERLMIYCGLDSLMEHHVWHHQKKEIERIAAGQTDL